ncbi:MAG: bifunctional glutamate N-acetyltransferase/amino-acid acetyltransferase ArgJ [Acidimicrobiia bacterium]
MSVTSVKGFIAFGTSADIKGEDKLDLAFIGSESKEPVLAAGVFTSNKLCAAPVTLTRENLEKSNNRIAGVIVNSGNANAATGKQGYENAVLMAKACAKELNVEDFQIGVCSTGWIGYQLPIEKITSKIPQVISTSNVDGGNIAAKAIMTTDTVEKTFFEVFTDSNGNEFSIGAIAKGAAMLQPNMATMLAFLTTDAKVSKDVLQNSLRVAASNSFNKLTVDGAQSTNDTVLVMSSEMSNEIEKDSFESALIKACQSLAKQMCDDAEGSTKTVKISVSGATNDEQANHGARRVANCQLVKCSWFGKDPYWGRVASELGASGIDYDFSRLTIAYGDHVVLKNGESLLESYDDDQASKLKEYMEHRDIDLKADLGIGDGKGWIYTNDLTYGYVEENMGTS